MPTDFADWLSPMLVKELRQGVRSRTFVSTFIILQLAMLLNVSLGLVTSSTDGSESSTIFFWVLVGVSILLILPLGGLNSVGGEIKANTLELIFLTRLNALRIVAGKWLAVFAQAVLLVSAVLPYLVLRYFIGGVDLANELLILAIMLGASAVLTSVTIGLSSYSNLPARVVLAVIVIIALLFTTTGPIFAFGRFGGSRAAGWQWLWQAAAYVACAAILLLLMLDVGASKIAPAAENHAATKRALAFAAFLVALGTDFLPGDSQGVTIISFVLASVICAAALCEQPRWVPSLYRPFARRGLLGRTLGRLLYPGWFSAVLFTTLLFGLFAALMAHERMLDSLSACVRLVSAFGTLLLPVAVIRFFASKTERPVPLFYGVQIICLVLLLVCSILDGSLQTFFLDIVTVLPLCSLCDSASEGTRYADVRVSGVIVVTLVSWLAALGLSLRPYRQVRSVEQAVLSSPFPSR